MNRPARHWRRGVDVVAEWMIERAARRWPADLSELMADEWRAELGALQESGVPAWRSLTFAGSIALSPAVEPEGEEPASRLWPAATAGVILLAAGLFNGVHVTQHLLGDRVTPALALALLAVPVLVMVLIGVRSRAHLVPRIVVLGSGLFAFLLAGNQVAVMPFMGWLDITPAVAVWTALSAGTAVAVTRLVAAARGKLALLTGVVGTLITLELATVAGSVHAAAELGLGYGSAAAWFPLALLPGGTVSFGGPASLGGLPASDILLGNASAMAGPMLLCSAFIVAAALRATGRRRQITVPWATRIDPQILLGAGAALAGLAVAELLRRLAAGTETAALHRIVDNSMVFGFGFFAHTPGRIVFALITGLLAAKVGDRLRVQTPSS